jgi:hypothetical protein
VQTEHSFAAKKSKSAECRTPLHAEPSKELLRKVLPGDSVFGGLKRHGNTKWRPIPLVYLALCWAWAFKKKGTKKKGDGGHFRVCGFPID